MENIDDDNYSTDSSEAREREAKKAIVEEVEEEESPNLPEYTDEEMRKLLVFIQQIATSYELSEEDIGESFTENVTKFLIDISEMYIFVYFDCGFLCASLLGCPTSAVSQLTYFAREDPGHVFSVDNFHDEIAFGTIHENVEETILTLLNCIFAPLILKDKRWDKNVKTNLFVGLHSFMAYLTDVNSKIGSMVVLYVPNEGNDLTIEQALLDKALVKRLENVIIYWISQIRLSLNDMENIVQNELACPSDEHDFWIYKFEVFSGIEQQIRHENIQHIINILDKSQSLFVKQFNALRYELNTEIQRSSSNASYLKLLVGPCIELEKCDLPKDVPPKLPKIIHLIRVISLNSDYYNTKKNTERLFSYLSSEIINFCKSKVDIGNILRGNPRFGIKICDMSIDCCLSYKLIFKRLLEQFTCEDFKKTWMLDEANIFNQINIFIQRLFDIIEICENVIVFGRVDESVRIPPLSFGCYNAHEFMAICKDVEQKFDGGLKIIKTSSGMILNVHNRLWYQEIASFKFLIRSLEEVIENLLVNVFLNIDNIEEALDVLTAMYNFSKRKNLQIEYTRRVEAMWTMFETEMIAANREITRSDKDRLACFPKNAGKSLNLRIRMKNCERLCEMLVNAHYLPKVPSVEDRLKMFETTIQNIKYRIDRYNNEWSNQISTQPNTYLNRLLINRSPTRGGLLESNIDRNILPIFEEAKYFEFMEITLTSILTAIYPKARRIIALFNNVVYVILLHSKILSSLSEKERLLFKKHVKLMEKKIAPGLFRLTYNDELTDSYINECLKHLHELQHFVDLYKIINMENVRIFEEISNDSLMEMQFSPIGSLNNLKQYLKESRNRSIKFIGGLYRKVIQYTIVVYDGFENQINGEMTEHWVSYVRKIDALAEYSLLGCARNALTAIFYLLYGKNNMSPDPVICVNATLVDRKIVFDPSLQSLSNTIQNIYKDLLKSFKLFPRLNEKFELPETNEIRKFHEVVADDKKCRDLYLKIVEVIEKCLENIRDYVDSWNLFRYVWEVDIEKFMLKYQEKGLELNEFESSMSKYFDVANQVLMQDTMTAISFVTLDCTKLKKEVLDCIAVWKESYKDTLCAATLRKLQDHHQLLTSTITALSEHSINEVVLDRLLKLYEQSMREIKIREADMEEIREYYKYLEKYGIDIPMTVIKNFNQMEQQWNWYNQKLREIDDTLYTQKEQFKMGFSTMHANDISEMTDMLDQQISTATII